MKSLWVSAGIDFSLIATAGVTAGLAISEGLVFMHMGLREQVLALCAMLTFTIAIAAALWRGVEAQHLAQSRLDRCDAEDRQRGGL